MSGLLIKTKKFILLLGDLACLYLGLYLTLMARYGYPVNVSDWQRHLIPFSLVFGGWLMLFFINDFYNLKVSYNTNNLLNKLLSTLIIGGIMAVLLFYFVGPLIDTLKPQRVLLIDLGITLLLLFFWRKIFYRFIKSDSIVNRVLIIGQTPLSEKLLKEINRRPQLGYRAQIIAQASNDLPFYCLENKIDILISSYELKNHPNTAERIFKCLAMEVDVYNINNFYEIITNRIPVEHIDHSWFLENLSENSKKLYEIIKRLTDVVLSIIGLIAAIPLTPFIALIIKLESPGPVIFKQYRIGKNGKKFLAMKFRSMTQDSEKEGPKWTTQNDARVTKFGKLIRKTRLDEIPQLINILKGEMSFVGPRPEQPEFVATLSEQIPFYKERLLVRPGLAGWGQLNAPWHGASKEDSLEKLEFDLYYIKNRSLFFDFLILLKTIRVVFMRKGQ